ncbi:MAG: site-specific DNA-methyltransferase [Verrucomicrobiae bacterium]|nr:site-specific DNA-methyltransferase [Verrucomicrobiae bacterium]
MGTLYYGDNLDILRRYLKDESVDLVYLDPPFNSAQNYNAFFSEKDGSAAASQIHAFEDTWHWDIETKRAYDAVTEQPGKVSDVMQAFYTFLGGNDMMAYLTMMSARLVELRRVLKPTGSLYLHCDPTASHYLKLLCDAIMGKDNFRNEIVWKRASAHNDPRKCGDIHDTILFYSKSNTYIWNPQYTKYTQDYLDAEWNELPSGRYWKAENMLDPRNSMELFDFKGTKARWRTSHEKLMELWNAPQTDVPNSHGRIKLRKDGKPSKRCRIMFLDELPGVPLQSIWPDIPSLRGGAAERLGYPTQKPVALLERIIQASSNPGDVVLDPFCGCGTTIDAAEKLGRDWIGIDVTQLAISLIKNRLQDTYGRRLKFISGSNRRESAQTSSAPESQSGLTSAATAATARGVHAASPPEHEATSKRAEARAPEGRAGSPLPAAEPGESSASPDGAQGTARPTRDGAHGVTRPTDVHVVRIIGEPSPSPIMKKRGSPRRFRLHFRAWARSTTATTSTS